MCARKLGKMKEAIKMFREVEIHASVLFLHDTVLFCKTIITIKLFCIMKCFLVVMLIVTGIYSAGDMTVA